MSLGKTRGVAAALLAISMLASLAVAEAASAATVSTPEACNVAATPHQEKTVVPVAGSGYTPGEKIVAEVVEDDESIIGYEFFVTDGAGNFAGEITNTYTFNGETTAVEKERLRVRGGPDEGTLAEAPLWMAYREVWITPKKGVKPGDKVNYEIAGFKSKRPLFAHYVHNGHEVLSQKLGTTTGPCGVLNTRAKLFPAKHSHFGKYDVQFDNSKQYKPKAHPKVVQELTTGRF